MCIRDRISPAIFQEFAWPALHDEVVAMTHNIFHLDGKGVCLLYTSDAADERSSVDLGGRRIIKKKK